MKYLSGSDQLNSDNLESRDSATSGKFLSEFSDPSDADLLWRSSITDRLVTHFTWQEIFQSLKTTLSFLVNRTPEHFSHFS